MKPLRSFILLLVYLCFHAFETKAQWTQVNNGLTATDVAALAVSGTNLFAGTRGGGVSLSTNNGTSWTAVNTGLGNTNVGSLAVSGTNLFAGIFGGVFISTNNGTSWTQTGLTNNYVRALAVSGTNLFAGTMEGGVYLSTNNGTSWTAVYTGLPNTYVLALAVSGTNLFAGTYGGGVSLSTNNGTSWTAVNTGLGNTYVHSLAVSGTNLFAGTIGPVFLSTNNGTSWTAVNAGLPHTTVHSLLVSGTNLFAGTSDGVFLSTNNGTSWVNTGSTTTTVYALAVSDTNLFAGTYGGVWTRPLSDWVFLLTPANGSGGITPPAAFKWKANPRALAYVFQISTDGSFSNLVVNQYTTDTTYTASNLQLTTAYYWRVRAENTTWTSEWGNGSFTTKLTSAPQLSSPVSAATLVSVTPTFSWSPVVSTATYTLQLSTRPAFDALEYSKDTTSTSVIPPQLQRSTTYYWRVRAQTPGDTTVWSSVSSFTTVPNAPNGISLVYPDSSKQDAYQNDWLTWRTDTTATSYLIQISQSPLFTTIYDSATVKSAGYRSRNKVFVTGSTYFWRVRGSNLGGDGQFSAVWSFRVGSGVRVPVTLYSSSNLDYGRVKVGQYKDTVVTISNNGNDTLKISNISSPVGSFSARPTSATIPPGKSFPDTILFTPTSGGNWNTSMVVYSNAPTSPDSIKVTGFGLSYGLRLSTARVDVGLVLLGKHKDTTFTITNTGSDTLKITGISSSAQGITTRPTTFSISPNGFATDTIRFSPTILGPVLGSIIVASNAPTSQDSIKVTASGVTATTGIEQDGVPISFELKQNYPNPFNPSTTISYSLPKTANVSLRIFNTLGQEVALLLSEPRSPGYYQVQWNANVPSGIYFYRLQAGEFVETKKMILSR